MNTITVYGRSRCLIERPRADTVIVFLIVVVDGDGGTTAENGYTGWELPPTSPITCQKLRWAIANVCLEARLTPSPSPLFGLRARSRKSFAVRSPLGKFTTSYSGRAVENSSSFLDEILRFVRDGSSAGRGNRSSLARKFRVEKVRVERLPPRHTSACRGGDNHIRGQDTNAQYGVSPLLWLSVILAFPTYARLRQNYEAFHPYH